MDGSRFDDLTRALAVSRRGMLKQLAAGLFAGAGGLLGVERAAQACGGLGRKCVNVVDCCSGACDVSTGRCVCAPGTEECGRTCLPIDQYQSDVENCGGCRVRCRQAPDCHLPACLAGVCGSAPDPAKVGQSCGSGGQVCAADGTCGCPPALPTACRRGCVDTASDPNNCGACDNRCPGTANGTVVCTGGVCGVNCNTGYVTCGGGCCAADRDCCNGECCGSNECCAADGCVPCHCEIGIEAYDAGEVNPANACQYCDPTRNRFDWTIAGDDTFCGEGRECCNGECCSPTECCDGVQCSVDACPDQCEIQGQPFEADQLNPANACQVCKPDRNRFDWTLVDDQTACGGVPGRVCCNGECCSPTECCNPVGFCEECGPHCRIGDQDIDEGAVNPANKCEVCNPEANFRGWSPAPDDADCGTGQFCCAGQCCPPGQCCNDGTCGECHCEIGGNQFDQNEVNPFNKCQICNPDRDRDDWSPGPNNGACGLSNDRFCCAGDCCPAGECCNAIGECVPCGCVISGEPVLEDAVNPDNTCQACRPNRDRRNWTVLDDDEPCGNDADDRVCCGGICCPQGQCCVDGACLACGCEIGNDDDIDPGTINQANTCQICDPSRARLDWSPVDNGTACGTGDQRCCGGECCAEDECCILDACGTCLCSIGGAPPIAPDTPNPDNPCEVCDPRRDPFDWSTADDRKPCGENRVCCAGTCCEPGLCCTLGVCGFCGCRIGETEVAERAVNPENECQICDPVQDPFNWSPRSDEPCGDNQVCCGGVCCARGECCSLHDVCEACPCEIGGELHDAGTVNPVNACEVCNPALTATDWSLVADNEPCADNPDRVCCRGVCCTEGNCCHSLEGTCGPGPCHCTIGEDEVAEGDLNPANACERCDPTADPVDWTPLPDDSPCGETGNQVCCLGTCCAPGHCCTLGVCGLCGCLIEGQTVAEGTVNPLNECQICDPVLDPFNWSPVADDSFCGEAGNQVCCAGVCCGLRRCCRPDGVCDIEFCGMIDPCEHLDPCGCTIGGVFFPNLALNPGNECQRCDVSRSTTDWSPNGFAHCGPTGEQFCNGRGSCCALGICPDLTQSSGCGDFCDAVCVIEGVLYRQSAVNPTNPCLICAPGVSHTSWSHICSGTCCSPLVCGTCD